MYAAPRNRLQYKALLRQMCIICLHLAKRYLTIRFFAAMFTGVLLTVIFYQRKERIPELKFRLDQSKFEYDKNPYASAKIDMGEASIWNSSWDGYVYQFFVFVYFI